MKREEFEKRMAGVFDLTAYVDAQGDIRYSDSHTGCLGWMAMGNGGFPAN
ncbi:hypothetical protein OS049_07640 [Pseudomonas aeruginosa]|nr:hypothetical protein [Pseudomonas aeruginosa]MDE9773706.1 hypothetical protein [Pseudomonas aeruginosa]